MRSGCQSVICLSGAWDGVDSTELLGWVVGMNGVPPTHFKRNVNACLAGTDLPKKDELHLEEIPGELLT